MHRILIATANPGKSREIIAVLTDPADAPIMPPVRWLSLADLKRPVPPPVEDGTTFAENAACKARYYARETGFWTLADDSGLEVDALGGAPGIHSARYAQLPPETPRAALDRANNKKLLAALAGVRAEARTARFRCALALVAGDRVLAEVEGAIEGRIIDTPSGTGGFGYDPYFLVPSIDTTTAALPPDEKNRISHRGQALRGLLALLPGLLGQQ
ncbi:MAG: non-canonical purine NTP pyrophosphatase [Phycisphaerae bacterium]